MLRKQRSPNNKWKKGTIFVRVEMLDTIHIKHHWVNDAQAREVISRLSKIVSNKYNELDYCGNKFFSCRWRNLMIRTNDREIKISGSIPKFIYGQNFDTPTQENVKDFFSILESNLAFSMDKFVIKRIDIGANVVLSYPVKLYFKYLGTLRYHKRFIQKKSLYYQNNLRQFIFYDKHAAPKHNAEVIPDYFKDKHLLRTEYRLTKRVNKRLGLEEFSVSQLLKKDMMRKLRDLWHEQYLSIRKLNPETVDLSNVTKPKDFLEIIAQIGINSMGEDQVLSLIEELKARGCFDHARYYRRTKTMIKELSDKQSLIKNPYIEELDKKMMEIQFQ